MRELTCSDCAREWRTFDFAVGDRCPVNGCEGYLEHTNPPFHPSFLRERPPARASLRPTGRPVVRQTEAEYLQERMEQWKKRGL